MLPRVCALFALFSAVPLSADNFIGNPGFDVDLAHWAGVSEAVWSPIDELGDPASGSVEIEIGPHTSTYITSTCFPVGPGQQLVYGANADPQSSEPHVARVGAALRFFDQPNCAGSSTFTPYPSLTAESSYSGWGTSQATPWPRRRPSRPIW